MAAPQPSLVQIPVSPPLHPAIMSDYTTVADGLRLVSCAIARLELHTAVRRAMDTLTRNTWNASSTGAADAAAPAATDDASNTVQHISECEQHPRRFEDATWGAMDREGNISGQQLEQITKIASWEEAPESLRPGAEELRGPAQRLGAGVLQAAWYATSGPDSSMPQPIQFEANLTKAM